MNAKESINSLRDIAEFWDKAANHPKYYNTEGAHYLAMAARSLFEESNRIESLYEEWGITQIEEKVG